MFPVSIKGTVRLKKSTPATERMARITAERIASMLDETGADNVSVEGTEVTFTVGLFSPVFSWNILALTNSGTVTVDITTGRVRIRYRFRTTRMMAMTFVLTGAMGGAFAVQGSAWTAVSIGAGAWLWIFGLSYLIHMIRVPLWLRRGLRDLVELKTK